MHTRLSLRWPAALAALSLFFTVAQAEQGGAAGQGAATQQGQGQQGRGGARGGGQPARDAQVQQQAGTAMIIGQVVTGDAGSPVRRARVNLSGQDVRTQKATLTDDEGRFVFTLLPAGRYTVNASKAGFVNIAYGAKGPGRAGTPIQLADGQKLETKAMSLPKGGVVTGTVLEENGEPAPGTTVRAMRQVIRTGEKRLESAGTDTTDDRGQYRIYGLQPGQFVVYAQPRNQGLGGLQTSIATEIEAAMQQVTQMLGAGGGGLGRGGGQAGRGGQMADLLGQMGGGRGQQALEQLQQQMNPEGQQQVTYAPVFYPGTTSPSNASRVDIVAGQERFGVDFQLQLTQTAQVDGVVVGPEDATPNGTQITLVPKDSLPGLPGNSQTARAGANGQFVFRNVLPGQYSVVARGQVRPPAPAGAQTEVPAGGRGGRGGGRANGGTAPEVLWALADLTVDGRDQTGVSLQLQRGMTISGRIAFDGQSAPPTDLSRGRVNLTPVGTQDVDFGGIPPAMVDANGRFTLTGVPPGRYSLRGNIGGGGGGSGLAAGGGGGRGGAARAGGQAGTAGTTASWTLASSIAGGRDSLDFPLVIGPGAGISDAVITFTDKTTELTGTLQDAAGTATSDYSIIVFPTDRQYWQPQSRRIQSVRPSTDGRFTVRNLPPGAYSIVAVTDVEPGEWFDPEFLSQLAGAAMRLTLGEGEKKTQDIRIAGGG
jgi:uncharacterized protein (DUF2141 family)